MGIVVFGISFVFGGIIGVLIGCYSRIHATRSSQSELYRVIGTDGEVRFTPFEFLR